MRSEEEKAIRAAALEYVRKLEEANDYRRASEDAARTFERVRTEADKAKEALLKLTHVGRNRPTRVITMSEESGLAVVVQWHEGGSGKVDVQHGGYATATLVGIDGEKR